MTTQSIIYSNDLTFDMRIIFDWFYFCFYCLAFSKGMKYERGAFGMNVTCGFYFSCIFIFVMSKLEILQFPLFRTIFFFVSAVVIFYLLDNYLINKRRYRIAIDRFLETPKFLKILYGIFALGLMVGNFFAILLAVSLAAK